MWCECIASDGAERACVLLRPMYDVSPGERAVCVCERERREPNLLCRECSVRGVRVQSDGNRTHLIYPAFSFALAPTSEYPSAAPKVSTRPQNCTTLKLKPKTATLTRTQRALLPFVASVTALADARL